MDPGFRALYQSAYPRLVRVLTVAGGHQGEAEEIVQEAFVRLLTKWSTVSHYDDPEAWVRKVAFRLLSNRFRGTRTLTHFLRRSPKPEPVAAHTADRVDIDLALSRLPTGQRLAIVLHHLVGLPVEQVAAELGVPVGTVKSRLSRGRETLAVLLREELPDHA